MLCILKIEKEGNVLETINVGTSFNEELIKKVKLGTRLDSQNTIDYLVDQRKLFEEWFECLKHTKNKYSAGCSLINITSYGSLDEFTPRLGHGDFDSVISFLYTLKVLRQYVDIGNLHTPSKEYDFYIEVL